jgi:CO/xanthine dehydrogenase FAD-binding subunit
MSMSSFEYFAPTSLDEAVALLSEKGRDARLMAGGTDLLVKIQHRVLQPKAVVGLKKIKGLDRIAFDPKKGLTIGATALLADVAAHRDVLRHYPAVAAAAAGTANVQVRNMGTVIGNLCNASPSADNAPTLLVMDAKVDIVGPQGPRQLPLGDFFQGPGLTALEPGEIVTAVYVPLPPAHSATFYQSLSARGKLDCSAVGVAGLLAVEGSVCRMARVAVGACAPIPMRAKKAEKILTGKALESDLIQKAALSASKETRPITDLRASADYRWKMVAVLTMRVLHEAHKAARSK